MKRTTATGFAAGVLTTALVAVGLTAVATPQDPCEGTYTAPMNSTAKLKAYQDCRFDRIEKQIAALDSTSPEPSATPSASASPSETPTVTPEPSVTPSETPSASATPTATTEPSASQTPTEPVSGTLPTRSNTGPRSTATSTVGGNVAITTKRAISRVHYTGSVTLYAGATGTTLTDVTVDGSILIEDANGVTIDYSEVAGFYLEGGADLTIDHSFFGDQNNTFMQLSCDSCGANSADRIKVSNSLFAGLQKSPPGEKHLQAVHLLGVYDSTWINNVFDYRIPDNDAATKDQISSTFQWETSFKGRPDKNTTMLGNVFYGGVFQQISPSGVGNVFRDNQFNSAGGPSCSSIVYKGPDYRTPTQSGNTCDGKPITLP